MQCVDSARPRSWLTASQNNEDDKPAKENEKEGEEVDWEIVAVALALWLLRSILKNWSCQLASAL